MLDKAITVSFKENLWHFLVILDTSCSDGFVEVLWFALALDMFLL